ncbi:MAG: alpha-1,4-glucan--maltose-1-phosphate maltosyltransferase [Desulfuromonadaceae bacterium]|nr:alpha-1,4-glucan--maltose-1-phosphate maltosyltransferase [Desulfuromonadaceae bacterium]
MSIEKRQRVVIEDVSPQIDGGRFPIKRAEGEEVLVEADIFTDGHDLLTCRLLYRREEDRNWSEAPLTPLVNDRWRGRFRVTGLGRYLYAVTGWVDHFATWQRDLKKRVAAGQDLSVELLIGAELVDKAARSAATAVDRRQLEAKAARLRSDSATMDERIDAALDDTLTALMASCRERPFPSVSSPFLEVVVDRERARFSTWYELFPRSCTSDPQRHGTFRDCEAHLPGIAAMGFDVIYLPPVHPIGVQYRKGKNNTNAALPGDVGSPWAIGGVEGGHKAIHPQLGTLEDFRRLVEKAAGYGLEVAMDLAYQCSPDHPYVKEHPEWFRRRPDGSVQYAENPPKKYQDIYPLHFETEAWRELWEELRSVVLFWIEQGIRIFRVDNPHTKPFRFWEWLIAGVRRDYPEVIFLAEAFTRPRVMHHLAKLGFTQSYTYFTWRNTKAELTEYFLELTRSQGREYLRPNLWPNTPDILTEYLQIGGRPAFMVRLVLAATLGGSYGIYGPAFELCENVPVRPGSEEYLDSEKYQIRCRDPEAPHSLRPLIARINCIRRENRALQRDWNLSFHPIDNDQLLCYSKRTDDLDEIILIVVNLDPHHRHSGWLELPMAEFGLEEGSPYQLHDLLSEARFLWSGPRNFVELDPRVIPAHIFRVRRKVRSERDFDYYL